MPISDPSDGGTTAPTEPTVRMMLRHLELALRELEPCVKRDGLADTRQAMDYAITSFVPLRDHLRASLSPESSR